MSGKRLEMVWEYGSTGVLVLIALVMLSYYLHDRRTGESVPRGATETLQDWRGMESSALRFGAEDPEIVVTAFLDFSCPFCRGISKSLDSLMAELPGQVAVDFFHFPLRGRLEAVPDAIKAECADQQGRFPEMYRTLFASADERDLISSSGLAAKAGVPDIPAFIDCIHQPPEAIPRIARGREMGDSLGVSGTPTMWINGHLFEGRDLAAFRKRARALGVR